MSWVLSGVQNITSLTIRVEGYEAERIQVQVARHKHSGQKRPHLDASLSKFAGELSHPWGLMLCNCHLPELLQIGETFCSSNPGLNLFCSFFLF
jgi:hypothetical protein